MVTRKVVDDLVGLGKVTCGVSTNPAGHYGSGMSLDPQSFG
jgi:hypothetical protein